MYEAFVPLAIGGTPYNWILPLPSLLPKRKRRPNSEFLLDLFHAALSQYAREHPMPQFKHCVVCFSNIYNRDLPTRRVPG